MKLYYFIVANSSTNQAYGYFSSKEQAEYYVSLTGSSLCKDAKPGEIPDIEDALTLLKSGSQKLIIKETNRV